MKPRVSQRFSRCRHKSVGAAERADKDAGLSPELSALDKRAVRLRSFCEPLDKVGLGKSYEAAHARLALQRIATIQVRQTLQCEGRLKPLPATSQVAADKLSSIRS